jgi:hypothetical protein
MGNLSENGGQEISHLWMGEALFTGNVSSIIKGDITLIR